MQSFYNGLNGMANFSKSLDNVSNNISNMNTPGYKGNDVFVRSLGGDGNNYGTQLESTSPRMQAGDLRQTGNDLDLAIVGGGYFVLRDNDGRLSYTRAGQFKFDENNKLVDGATDFSVMSINNGVLQEFDISNYKILPPVATSRINLIGNLSSSATETTDPHVVSNISVFDIKGESHNLTMEFVRTSVSGEWEVAVKDELDAVLTTFKISFDVDATPSDDFSSIFQTLTFNGVAQAIEFNLGDTGSLSGATQLGGFSSLAATVVDGHEALGLRSYSFSDDGIMKFMYAGGEEKTGQQIALAYFGDPSTLTMNSNGVFTAPTTQTPVYGKPNQNLFGAIQGKSIELSNVDLTQEFADILIIQRGYQASSRVMSVANDMLEQLYNNTRK